MEQWIDPPAGAEVEEKECGRCRIVKDVNVESDYCDECLEGMGSAAHEAKFDEAKDEGRI